mgnify:CR=1 FL=1
MSIDKKWNKTLKLLDYAFQPIVNINTGVCIGVEALLRGYKDAGFKSINEIFDKAFDDDYIIKLENLLREKAVSKFIRIPFHDKIRLFLNVDSRIWNVPGENIEFNNNGFEKSSVVFDVKSIDINENKYGLSPLEYYRKNDIRICVDDYGLGAISFDLLYDFQTDFIKIHEKFINNIAHDHKKRTVTMELLNLSQLYSSIVIAECVDNTEDFLMCNKIGFDYIQGNIVQQPEIDIEKIQFQYDNVVKLNERSKSSDNSDHRLIHEQLEFVPPIISNSTSMSDVFEMFKSNENITYFPVVNSESEPLGIIREKDLKKYVYSKFGKEILVNQTVGKTVNNFISKCPITEIYKSIEKILEIYSMDEETEGIILTANTKYIGMLNAKSLLKALHEKNLSEARDANPLTKLPGNSSISKYLTESYYDEDFDYIYAYFDFDNFKPFNDKYGFRVGDRAILLFADLLRAKAGGDFFSGHVGGDDFFAGIRLHEYDEEKAVKTITKICKKFAQDILAFISDEDRENGYIIAKSRSGRKKKFPLLGASVALLHLTRDRKSIAFEEISSQIAKLKKKAKSSEEKFSIKTV